MEGMQCKESDGEKCLGPWMPLWRQQMSFLVSRIIISTSHGHTVPHFISLLQRVPHLRSPVSHHPDPSERSILWQYAMRSSRTTDTDLVPLGLLRDKLYTGPFILPSTSLFWEFCGKAIVDGFALGGCVQGGDVVDVKPVSCDCEGVIEDGDIATLDKTKPRTPKLCDHFEVTLRCGKVYQSRNVVIATGASSAARNIPDWAEYVMEIGGYPAERLAHCLDIALDDEKYFAGLLGKKGVRDEEKLKGMRVVIVGGGITRYGLRV